MAFASQQAWADWLEANHASSRGVWLKLAKNASGVASVTYADAIEAALAWGWIDGQKQAHDDAAWPPVLGLRARADGGGVGRSIQRVSRLVSARGRDVTPFCSKTDREKPTVIIPGAVAEAVGYLSEQLSKSTIIDGRVSTIIDGNWCERGRRFPFPVPVIPYRAGNGNGAGSANACLERLIDPGRLTWPRSCFPEFHHENWRARPLVDHETVVQLIGNTRTQTGLHVRARLDTHSYSIGIRIPDRPRYRGHHGFAYIPSRVLAGHSAHKVPQSVWRPWSPGLSLMASVVLLGDELAVPTKNGVRRDDATQLAQDLPPEGMPRHGEATPLCSSYPSQA
jgi:hypothetical protein